MFELFSLVIICGLLSFGSCLPAKRASFIDDMTNLFFDEKCLGELGCFGNGPPYFDFKERPISLLPEDRDTIGTEFHLYTPESRNSPYNFTYENPDINKMIKAGFSSTRRTVFIIHGFMAHLAPVWMEPMKDAILDVEDCNVFLVVWAGGDGPWYELSVSNTRVVGAEIALLISNLQKKLYLNPKHVYLIGHSLGAHIAGYAGKRVPNLGRITGMDPAGPYFENVQSSIRLNSTDALFVDVIHTDAATNRFQGFGTTESIGHLDFWVNGGSKQPGCPDMGSAILDFLMNPSLNGPEIIELMCHHHRAIELMLSSLKNRSCPILASVCTSWDEYSAGHCEKCGTKTQVDKTKNIGQKNCVELGYLAEKFAYKTVNLNLYVKTSEKWPYCLKSSN